MQKHISGTIVNFAKLPTVSLNFFNETEFKVMYEIYASLTSRYARFVNVCMKHVLFSSFCSISLFDPSSSMCRFGHICIIYSEKNVVFLYFFSCSNL